MNDWQAEIRILVYNANDWRGKYVACLYEAEDLAVADDQAIRRATGSGDTPLEAAAALLKCAVSEYRRGNHG
jgi:hypothetical protein